MRFDGALANRKDLGDFTIASSFRGEARHLRFARRQTICADARSCSYRMGNDVSAVAVDAAEYDTYSEGGWITVDGTSISSPFCAGIFGLAGNSTGQDGRRTFWKPKSHRNDLYEVSGRYTSQGG